MRARSCVAAAIACAALAGPAAAQGLFDDNVARQRIAELRKQVEAAHKAFEERFARIEERVGRAEDRSVLVDLAAQIEALRGEIARLRGQLEVVQYQIETADKRGKDLYLDIDTRLRKLEQAREQAAAQAEKPPAEAGPTAAETRVYEAALNQFKLGNYALAISAFQGFLVAYPNSKLAPSAQYWIGNAYAAQNDHKQAIAAHQKVLSAWPNDARAADAMLNIATAQEALGDRRAAQKTLQELLARYPESAAAASARQRLQALAKLPPAKR